MILRIKEASYSQIEDVYLDVKLNLYFPLSLLFISLEYLGYYNLKECTDLKLNNRLHYKEKLYHYSKH